MSQSTTSSIDQFSHLFLTVEDTINEPLVQTLTFHEKKELLLFFGIDKNPFIDSVDPLLYYKTAQHEAAFKKLRHSIEDSISLGLLTAPSGMGKTLITQLLKEDLPPEKYDVISIKIGKKLTKTAFMKNILYELGFSKIHQGNALTNDLAFLLNDKVREGYQKKGRRLVLLLDEAQFLTLEIWFLIKMISNIEVPKKKLTTTLLFGEDFLLKRLRHKNFASISNRMYIKEKIRPFNLPEMKQYLQYKLDQVNFKGDLFAPEIYNILFVATGGICREINNLVYNALIEAFYMKKRIIDNDVLLKCL
ncbi:MAG: AAA family ATPase [Candidatus Margulisiibacteriota bacterium]